MFGLLYSLRTRQFEVPFMFDVSHRGFERGVWTENINTIVGDFTFDNIALGFDRGLWSTTDTDPNKPFTLDDHTRGFDVGLWSTSIAETVANIKQKSILSTQKQTFDLIVAKNNDFVGYNRNQFGTIINDRLYGNQCNSLIDQIVFDESIVYIKLNRTGDYSNITKCIITIGDVVYQYSINQSTNDNVIVIASDFEAYSLSRLVAPGIKVSLTFC